MYSCDLILRNICVHHQPLPHTSSNVKLLETSKKLVPGHAFHYIFLSALVFNVSIFSCWIHIRDL